VKPSIGRIIHVVEEEAQVMRHRAAIITEIGNGPGLVRVEVFGLGRIRFTGEIPEDQTAATDGSWHWPEREE
jgi:hypothetical protein